MWCIVSRCSTKGIAVAPGASSWGTSAWPKTLQRFVALATVAAVGSRKWRQRKVMAAVGAGSFGDFVQEITRITLTLETSEANGFFR